MATTFTPPDTYLPDNVYYDLVERLLNLPLMPSFDPRSSIVELLGDLAGLWPASIDPERTAG